MELHFSQCSPNPNKRVPIKPLYANVPLTCSGVVWDTLGIAKTGLMIKPLAGHRAKPQVTFARTAA